MFFNTTLSGWLVAGGISLPFKTADVNSELLLPRLPAVEFDKGGAGGGMADGVVAGGGMGGRTTGWW